jgi:hypothetical protein
MFCYIGSYCFYCQQDICYLDKQLENNKIPHKGNLIFYIFK